MEFVKELYRKGTAEDLIGELYIKEWENPPEGLYIKEAMENLSWEL